MGTGRAASDNERALRIRLDWKRDPTQPSEAVAQRHGVSIRTAQYHKKKLMLLGIIKPPPPPSASGPSVDDFTGQVEAMEQSHVDDTSDPISNIDLSKPMSYAEIRQHLEHIARTSRYSRERRGALIDIAKLDNMSKQRDDIGPGDPLTSEDRVERLSRILAAVGREISDKAFAKAFIWT